MSVAKVIELIADGETIEAAVNNAAREASETLRGVRGIYVKDIRAWIKDGGVVSYRVTCKTTFLLDDEEA